MSLKCEAFRTGRVLSEICRRIFPNSIVIIAVDQERSQLPWGKSQEKSFQELKDKLTSAPILTISSGTEGYVIYSDASNSGLGCVLMQHDRAMTYAFKQLKNHEKNYPTHDLELVAVIFTLKIWRYYLYSVSCEIYTDHKSLKYIFTRKELNMHQRMVGTNERL